MLEALSCQSGFQNNSLFYQPAPESPKPCIKMSVAVCFPGASCTIAVSFGGMEVIFVDGTWVVGDAKQEMPQMNRSMRMFFF